MRFLDHVILASAMVMAAAGGCTRQPYALAPVSGKVSLDGEPLTEGVVSFQPIAGRGTVVGPGSTGRIDAEGRYRLSALDGSPGAVVGEHVVRIYSVSPESAPKSDSDTGPRRRERVPPRYNYATELRHTVLAGGSAEADFPLTTDASTP